MYRNSAAGKRLIKLVEAFGSDGFEIGKTVTYNGRLGVIAESRTAVNYDTKLPKKAYYLEGNAYETGFLMGSLAEAEISRMALEFANKVVFSFIGSKLLEKMTVIQEALIKLLYNLTKETWEQLPEEIRDEIRGVLDGCKSRNSNTKVDLDHLVVLNAGIDILCSRIYTGVLKRGVKGLEPDDLRIPFMCNAFTVCGKSAGNGFYFGRDFMFPTAGVFQEIAAMVIYNPAGAGRDAAGRDHVPHISITAPGMVGSISVMNSEGVALGVNMSPGANCDTRNIGVNSLLLTRLCAAHCRNAMEAARYMSELPRGVAWNYIIADGKNNLSCAAEAGASGRRPDFTRFPAEEYRPFLPDHEFIKEHMNLPYKNGIMFRWNNYKYPEEYLKFNEGLWEHYNKAHSTSKAINEDAFNTGGYINRSGETNCPSSYYFAPQREESDDVLIVGNNYILPEMRYFAMSGWLEKILEKSINDLQWRYDDLNALVLDTITEKGTIGFEDARKIIGFLTPDGKNPGYYNDNPRSKDGAEIRIEGCDSVFDLKNMIVESHYGYYRDEWVRLSLSKYANI